MLDVATDRVLELTFARPAWAGSSACAVAVVLSMVQGDDAYFSHAALVDAPRRRAYFQTPRDSFALRSDVGRVASVPGLTVLGVRASLSGAGSSSSLTLVKAAAARSGSLGFAFEVDVLERCESDAPALAFAEPQPLAALPRCRLAVPAGSGAACEVRVPAECGFGFLEWADDAWSGVDSCRVVLEPAARAACASERLELLDDEWRVKQRSDGAREGVELQLINDTALSLTRLSSASGLPGWIAIYERLAAPPIAHSSAPQLPTKRAQGVLADFINECDHGVVQLHNDGQRDSVLYFRPTQLNMCFDLVVHAVGARRLAFDFFDAKNQILHLYGTYDPSLPVDMRISAPSVDLLVQIGCELFFCTLILQS